MASLIKSADFIIRQAKRYGGEPRASLVKEKAILYHFNDAAKMQKFQDTIMAYGLFAGPHVVDPWIIVVTGD